MTTRPVVVIDKILDENDVAEVVREILHVQNQSITLGRVLKLRKVTVDSICQEYINPQDRLFRVVDEFVKQVEPSPTWRVIVNALRDPLINQPRLALEIERKYCSLPPVGGPAGTISPSELVPIPMASQASTSVVMSPDGYDIDKIEEDIKILEDMFHKLKRMVLTLLQVNAIKVEVIVHNLTELPASQMSQHEPYFEKNLDKLEKCTEHIPLFSRLNLHWNYLSPQLLFHLVREFLADTDAKKEMISYDAHLSQFRCCTHLQLFCQIEEEDIEPPEGFSKIVAKFEKHISEKTTLEDVEKFRLRLARHYRLRDFALMLKPKIRPGSFIVSFFVPSSVLERLKVDVPKKDIFEDFGITRMDVDEYCVYCDVSATAPAAGGSLHMSMMTTGSRSATITSVSSHSLSDAVPGSAEVSDTHHSTESSTASLQPQSSDGAHSSRKSASLLKKSPPMLAVPALDHDGTPERMRDWICRMVDSGRFHGLEWINPEMTIFRVPWIHAKKRGFCKERDAALFREWAIHSGRYRDESDPTVWKINFRCAINGLKDIMEIKDLQTEDCRVYKVLPSRRARRKPHRRFPNVEPYGPIMTPPNYSVYTPPSFGFYTLSPLRVPSPPNIKSELSSSEADEIIEELERGEEPETRSSIQVPLPLPLPLDLPRPQDLLQDLQQDLRFPDMSSLPAEEFVVTNNPGGDPTAAQATTTPRSLE